MKHIVLKTPTELVGRAHVVEGDLQTPCSFNFRESREEADQNRDRGNNPGLRFEPNLLLRSTPTDWVPALVGGYTAPPVFYMAQHTIKLGRIQL